MLQHYGMILWLTGLPASGKTTIATSLYQQLRSEGAKVQLLDDDIIRALNYGKLGLSKEDRNLNVEQVGNTASILKEHRIICIIAVIAPYREVRQSIIKKIGAIEIFVDAPLEVCIFRDPKGLYKRALRGEIKNFTGIDDPYEPPLTPHIHLQTDKISPEICTRDIINYLSKQGMLDNLNGHVERISNAYPTEKILSRFPFASMLLLRNYGMTIRGIKSFVDDSLLYLCLRHYDYPLKTLFVAGLPKSGTTWMKNMLSLIPGYHGRPVFDPTRSIFLHDISPLVFNLMPQYGYNVIKLHTRYTPENFDIIKSHVGKFVVMYRDLRDVCISRYFHVFNENSHRHFKLYNSISEEDGILHSINICKEYYHWVNDWHEIALVYPDEICEVRYEELHSDVEGTMRKVFSFFRLSHNETILKNIKQSQLMKPVDLKKSLMKKDTKRKGIIGDWKNHFTKAHKECFKDMAGDLLVRLGYETDNDW